MIYLRLAGGLGNQLYQLAAALLVATRVDSGIRIVTSGLSAYRVQRKQLLDGLLDFRRLHFDVDFRATVFAQAMARLRLGRVLPYWGLTDSNIEAFLSPMPSRHRGPLLLDGYFQRFWRHSDFFDVLGLITGAIVASDRQYDDLCVLHIRGGDFARSKVHHVVDVPYYVEALVLARDAQEISKITVLTDDRTFASEICDGLARALPDVAFQVCAPSLNPADDFLRIRDAPLRIVGNSTFAWWASALDSRRSPTYSPLYFEKSGAARVMLPWEFTISNSAGLSQAAGV